MISLTFILADGYQETVQAAPGTSVMKAAVAAGIQGIPGDCGGNLSCGTCHAYIDAEWRRQLPEQRPEELAMLDCVLDVTAESRLTCQITLTADLDGLVLRVPEFKL